jgi:tRNA (cytidine56-2'-O)-methyltransferase
MRRISVFRYGHRPDRDKRITTHVALVARAFGAHEITIDIKSSDIEQTITDVVKRFGGDFKIYTGYKWRTVLKEWEGTIVHLTMYGDPLEKKITEIKHSQKILVLVGGKKVPGEFHQLADYNIAIGSQPHSEVAALAIFLTHLKNKT